MPGFRHIFQILTDFGLCIQRFFVVVTVLLLAGCGYHFMRSVENRTVAGQTIWVGFINNDSNSPVAPTVLRRSLLDECYHMRALAPAGDAAVAELLLSGVLRSYSLQALSYTASDQVKEYRLTISVELELKGRGKATPLWKGLLQASHDYPVSSDLALQRNAEETAFVVASGIIAQKFLTAVEQSY